MWIYISHNVQAKNDKNFVYCASTWSSLKNFCLIVAKFTGFVWAMYTVSTERASLQSFRNMTSTPVCLIQRPTLLKWDACVKTAAITVRSSRGRKQWSDVGGRVGVLLTASDALPIWSMSLAACTQQSIVRVRRLKWGNYQSVNNLGKLGCRRRAGSGGRRRRRRRFCLRYELWLGARGDRRVCNLLLKDVTQVA